MGKHFDGAGGTAYLRVGKRVLDLTVVVLSAPAWMAFVLGCALVIRLADGGPAFFGQTRIGRGLEPFTLWKLRTMRSAPGGTITLSDDPRVTSIGRILRRLKLDELPQLWNVMRGDMSLVGPRPEVPEWVDTARDAFAEILVGRPGITDLASIVYSDEATALDALGRGLEGYRDVVLPHKLALARFYVGHLGWRLDARVIGLTLAAFIAPEWAVGKVLATAPVVGPPNLGPEERPLLGGLRSRITRLYRIRTATKVAIDGGVWLPAMALAALARFDFNSALVDWTDVVILAVGAGACQIAAASLCGSYRGRWRFASFDEVGALLRASVVTIAAATLADRFYPAKAHPLPSSVPLVAGIVAVGLIGISRFVWRIREDRLRRPLAGDCHRLMVFGAGEAGMQVVNAMLRDAESPYYPVALLDDDPLKQRLTVRGVPVAGTRHDIVTVAKALEAEALLIAIPSAPADVVAEVSARASDAGLTVKVLPRLSQLFGEVTVEDIRDMQVEDLLGRQAVEMDMGDACRLLRGKRVLVTGAGGSIGSEICRQVNALGPAQLLMLDRDESALHALQLSLSGHGLLDTPDLILADIRDKQRLMDLFRQHRPDVVFHAAALKHLPLLERAPGEAMKSNVIGTLNVLSCAKAIGVERFVNISTDKAADPTSVLGYSKRIAERLTAATTSTSGVYLSVRFGNVLGTRGSFIHAFRCQLESGGPITVTHPEVTRYFMTVQEAVKLVLQAAAVGRPGEALVLDMGVPVRIADVARRMVAAAKKPVDIVFTGLRPGEKLDEDLVGANEERVESVHPLISHIKVPPLSWQTLHWIDPCADPAQVLRMMRGLCTDPEPAGLPMVVDLRTRQPAVRPSLVVESLR